MSTQAADRPQSKIDDALVRVKRYQAMIDRMSPDGMFEQPNPLVARASAQAMEAAQQGLDALAQSPAAVRGREANLEARGHFMHQRLEAALRVLLLSVREEGPSEVVRKGVNPDADEASMAATRSGIDKELSTYRGKLGHSRAALKVVLEGSSRSPAPDRQMVEEAVYWAMIEQPFQAGQVMTLTAYRLRTHANELSSALDELVATHIDVLDANMQAYGAAQAVVSNEVIDRQALPEALESLENLRRQVDGMALQLCLIAAGELQSDSPVWKMVLECADSARVFSEVLSEQAEWASRVALAGPGNKAPSPAARGAAESSGAPAEVAAATSTKGAGRSRRRGGAGQRRARTESQQAPKPTAAPDPLGIALGRARQALAKCRAVPPAWAGGDPVEAARMLEQRVDTIDLLRRHHADPLHVARSIVASLPKWFGEIQPLRAASAELAALPPAMRSDAQAQQLSAELSERMVALQAMSDQVTAREVDDIKRYPFPKAVHLERLLDLDQIANVSPPARLPSPGDEGAEGTLFEMTINLKAMADGSPAPALYLHFHSETLITPEAAARMPLNEFAAVHVKSAQQRALGNRWEAMQQQLGRDTKVHRGPVGSGLVARLRRLS